MILSLGGRYRAQFTVRWRVIFAFMHAAAWTFPRVLVCAPHVSACEKSELDGGILVLAPSFPSHACEPPEQAKGWFSGPCWLDWTTGSTLLGFRRRSREQAHEETDYIFYRLTEEV